MSPRVFRGAPWRAGLIGIARLATLYFGVLAVLLVLGLVVRGWAGWALVVMPFAALVAVRLWAWQRVCVEVGDEVLRYEGSRPSEDFEVRLDALRAIGIDESHRDRPLVLTLEHGERRIALGRAGGIELHAHLVGLIERQPEPQS